MWQRKKKRVEIRAFLYNNKVSHKHVAQLSEVLSVCGSHRLQWHQSTRPQAMYIEKHPQFCNSLQAEVQIHHRASLSFPKDITLISGPPFVIFPYMLSAALGRTLVSHWRSNEVIPG